MSEPPRETVDEILQACLEIEEDDTRERVLVERCSASGHDPAAVRGVLAAMLRRFRRAAAPAPAPGPRAGAAPALPPGYVFERELGRGGMGVVYAATDQQLGRVVALKMILAGDHCATEDLVRFLHEAQTIARLKHPHIVEVHKWGDDGGRPFMVLEFCGEGSLAAKLAKNPLVSREAARVVMRLAQAAHAIHEKQLVHRDLKPGNVLLVPLAGDEAAAHPSFPFDPKVTDFGVVAGTEMTRTGTVLGTPSYMAPEQVRSGTATASSDTYALGVILYECLTGKPPFKAESDSGTFDAVLHEEPVRPRVVNRTVPRDLETIALKCLQKQPARRYASAAALADDLGRYLVGEPILARPAGVAERLWKWGRRHPTWAAMAGVVAAAVVGLAFLTGWALNERADAIEQRRHAEQNLAASADAISLALLETSEIVGDQPNGKELQKALLEHAFPPLESLIVRYQADPLLRAQLALAHQRLGDLYQLNTDQRALEHLENAVALSRAIDADGGTPATRAALASALRSHGNALRRQTKDHPEALDHLDEARRLCEEAGAADTGPPVLRAEVLCDLAEALKVRSGEMTKAIEYLEQARDLLLPFEGDDRCVAALARATSNLAGLYSVTGRRAEALDAYREAVERRKRHHDANPTRLSTRLALAVTLNAYGLLLHQFDKPEEARKHYLDARAHFKDLHEQHPQVPSYAHLYAVTTNGLGLLHMIWAGKREESRAYVDEVIALRRAKLGKVTDPAQLNSLGHAQENLAQILRTAGKKRAALALLDEIVSLRCRVCDSHPKSDSYRKHRAYTRCLRGEVLLELGVLDKAKADLDAALGDRLELFDKNKTIKAYRDDLALSYLALGALQRATGGRPLDAFDKAVDHSRHLKDEFPEYARHHACALTERGHERALAGQKKEALADLMAANEIGARSCAQQPGLWEHADVHARALYALGHWNRRWGHDREAREALGKARAIQADMHSKCKPHPDFASALALTLAELAELGPSDGADPAALRQEAAHLHLEATRTAPEVRAFAVRLQAHAALSGRPAGTRLLEARMSFADAMRPFAGHPYDYGGHIAADGKLRGKGLGCSAFTSVVLHRMRDGDDWVRAFDAQVHQWYGDKAAVHFGLAKVDTFASADLLDTKKTADLVKAGKVKAGVLYYFNARHEKNGHVGFVRFTADGSIEQWHYSSIAKGLYTGDYRTWLKGSMYRAATVELYVVPG